MDSCDYQIGDTESEDDYLDDEGGQVKFLTFPWKSYLSFTFNVVFGIRFCSTLEHIYTVELLLK